MFTNYLKYHLVLALILTTIAPLNHAKTEHQTISFTGISHIEVHNPCGNITVKTHNHNYVQVDQVTTYKKSNQKPEISNSVKNGTLTITVNQPSSSSTPQQWFSNIFTLFETKSNPQVDHTIRVPKGQLIDVTLDVGCGNIDATNSNGSLKASAGSGKLNITTAHGNIKADIGNGAISIHDAHGSVEAKAGNGTINITKAYNSITTNIGHGVINIHDARGPVDATAGNGTITITKSHNSIRANTAMGDINIQQYLGEAYVSLQTIFGSIQCPNGFTKTEQLMGSFAEGTIGNGQYLIKANTSMGSIILN